jgi:hypothetical protein
VLGAGKAGAFFASTAAWGREDTELGAEAGEEWSGVQTVGDGGRCGEIGRERVGNGVSEAAGVGHGGGVFGLRRWRLVLGTLTIFLGAPRYC